MTSPGLPSYGALALRFDRGTLLVSGFPPDIRPPGPPATDWQWDARVAAWRCHALHFADVRSALEARGVDVSHVLEPMQALFRPDGLPALRADQEAALDAWLAAGRRGQVIMPTGTGKTVVALAAMARLGASTLVVAPVRDLMYQWHRRILRDLGYDAGLVGDQHFSIRGVSVATYDSAFIHMERLGNRFELVVFDEEHHLPGARLREAALLCAAPSRLGLTATPERGDGRHLELAELVGPEVFRLGMSRAKGRLVADFEVVRIPVWLTPEEEERYGAARREVRRYILHAREQNRAYGLKDLAAESGRWATLSLTSAGGLQSAMPAPEEFDSRVEAAFAAKFGAEREGWRLVREGAIVHEGQTTFVPDFVFRHQDGTEVLFEIVGFWTPEYLEKKREVVRRARGHRLLLAVPERSLKRAPTVGDRVVTYKTGIKLEPVLAALAEFRDPPRSA